MVVKPDTNERIGRLETSVEALHSEFSDVRSTLKQIQETLTRSKETNWSVIFAGLAVVGSLYAAAIRPLNQEIERQRVDGTTLASAVIRQDEKINGGQVSMVTMRAEVDALLKRVNAIDTFGSPITDKRLTVLELQLKNLGGK